VERAEDSVIAEEAELVEARGIHGEKTTVQMMALLFRRW
jgi:hypothetical protein